jgi:hypothetical protein
MVVHILISRVVHFLIDKSKYEASLIRNSNLTKLNNEKHPIFDVIRLLGRKLQTEYMCYLLFQSGDDADSDAWPDIEPRNILFDEFKPITKDGKNFFNIKKELKAEKEISLNKDLILPWPWRKSRLISSLSRIGEGRFSGSWKQDDRNHNVELWLPLGIAWVRGGNHSITTGIAQGSGKIRPWYIYDISEAYDYVYCDGNNYIRKYDESIISPVKNVEFAVIFEIGRILRDKAISF